MGGLRAEEKRHQTRQTHLLASPRRHQTEQTCFAHLIMAAVRLRKAFRYPEDSEEDRQELDEEEQEQVIQRLQRQNDTRNSQYSVRRHHSRVSP